MESPIESEDSGALGSTWLIAGCASPALAACPVVSFPVFCPSAKESSPFFFAPPKICRDCSSADFVEKVRLGTRGYRSAKGRIHCVQFI